MPFRNSKLTYLLEDVFTGDSKVMMLAMVSPGLSCGQESMCTLGFAERAAAVNLRSSRVHNHPVDVVQRLRTRCKAMEAELVELRRQLTMATQVPTTAIGSHDVPTNRSSGDPSASDTSSVSLPTDVQRLVKSITDMVSSAVEASVCDRRLPVDGKGASSEPAVGVSAPGSHVMGTVGAGGAMQLSAVQPSVLTARKENVAAAAPPAGGTMKSQPQGGHRERRLSTGSAESSTSTRHHLL